jgi:hypothetical protein
MVLFQNSAPRGFGVGAGIGECPGSKKADEVILTGCTISQIERKAEMSAQVIRDLLETAACPAKSAIPPKAEVLSTSP